VTSLATSIGTNVLLGILLRSPAGQPSWEDDLFFSFDHSLEGLEIFVTDETGEPDILGVTLGGIDVGGDETGSTSEAGFGWFLDDAGNIDAWDFELDGWEWDTESTKSTRLDGGELSDDELSLDDIAEVWVLDRLSEEKLTEVGATVVVSASSL